MSGGLRAEGKGGRLDEASLSFLGWIVVSTASIETQVALAPANHTRMIERPSVILYSHDGFGIGHLSRTIYLAHRIREPRPDANLLLVPSSPAAHRLSALDDPEYIKLPSVTKAGAERYHPRNLPASLASIIVLHASL